MPCIRACSLLPLPFVDKSISRNFSVKFWQSRIPLKLKASVKNDAVSWRRFKTNLDYGRRRIGGCKDKSKKKAPKKLFSHSRSSVSPPLSRSVFLFLSLLLSLFSFPLKAKSELIYRFSSKEMLFFCVRKALDETRILFLISVCSS